eukprot:PhF_6_TR2328/c0_g1_i1/m.4149/K10798/PARP; poly [ADP-ribose] polymerase
MGDDDGNTFKTEYASSSKSQCNSCRSAIPQGELRIGQMVQSDKGDFKYPRWHHYTCFVDAWLPKNNGKFLSVDDVSGLDKIKFEDAKKIRALVNRNGGNGGGGNPNPTVAASATDAKEELAIAKQNDKVWAMKSKLEALENKELQYLLEHNDQPCKGKIFGGRNNLVDRAADAMVFGVLPKCSVCKDGDFYSSHGQYKCSGALDEFTRCTNVVSEETMVRGQFQVPEELRDSYPFLRSYKGKLIQKADAAVILKGNNNPKVQDASQNPKRTREEDEEKDDHDDDAKPALPPQSPKGPFGGLLVGSAGKLRKSQKAIEDIITSNGGVYDKGTHVHVFITSAKDVEAKSIKKLQDAIAADIPIVSEDWLDACVGAGQPVLGNDEILPYRLVTPKDATNDKTRENRKRVAERNLTVEEAQKQRVELDKEAMMREEFRDKPSVKSATKKLIVKGSAAVEPESGVADTAHVYERQVGKGKGAKKEVFSSTMSRTDVTTGKNSYYILQLLEADAGKKWYVFRKWGKLGHDDIGGTKLSEYTKIDGALKEFEKMFLDKTGNHWADRDNFVKHYDKMQPLDIDYGAEENSGENSAKPNVDYNGTLDTPTQNFIRLIFDLKAMTSALQEMNIDTKKMPLGKLSKKTIQEGFQALSELQKLLDGIKDEDVANLAAAVKGKIVSLSNKFYTFIPHQMSDPASMLLDTLQKVEKMTKLVETLREMEVTSNIISGSTQGAEGTEHPIDTQYKKLKTNFVTIPKGDPKWTLINDFLQNTHAPTHTSYHLKLVDLWEISREGEDDKFSKWKDYPNRRLLWHGSRLTNWVGILSQGLRIAPPEAPTTGYMFGKGVYFADMSSKSANYCFTSSDNTTGVMVLNEVALGNMKKFKSAFYVDGLESKYQSTMGEGKIEPDPRSNVTMDNGCLVQVGKPVDSGVKDTTLQYNEFVVYDTSQIRMKYVLRLEFVYKGKCGTFF